MMNKHLPPGWDKGVYCRKGGKKAGKWNVHFVTPCGIKISTKKKLKDFLKEKKLNHTLDDFDFKPSVCYGDSIENGNYEEPCYSSVSVASLTSNTLSGTLFNIIWPTLKQRNVHCSIILQHSLVTMHLMVKLWLILACSVLGFSFDKL